MLVLCVWSHVVYLVSSNLLELYGKVNAAVCSSQRPEQQLAVYRKLFDVLESAFPTQTEDTRALLGQCWCVLADGFTSFLKQVSNHSDSESLCCDRFHRLVLSMKGALSSLTSLWC